LDEGKKVLFFSSIFSNIFRTFVLIKKKFSKKFFESMIDLSEQGLPAFSQNSRHFPIYFQKRIPHFQKKKRKKKLKNFFWRRSKKSQKNFFSGLSQRRRMILIGFSLLKN